MNFQANIYKRIFSKYHFHFPLRDDLRSLLTVLRLDKTWNIYTARKRNKMCLLCALCLQSLHTQDRALKLAHFAIMPRLVTAMWHEFAKCCYSAKMSQASPWTELVITPHLSTLAFSFLTVQNAQNVMCKWVANGPLCIHLGWVICHILLELHITKKGAIKILVEAFSWNAFWVIN